MRSDEVHLYNGFIYLFIYFFWCFQKFDPKAKYNKIFVSGVRPRWSPARFWQQTVVTLGHIATVKIDGKAGRKTYF